ncbi:MAG: hypothetical protein NDI90_04805 [Nitrospira sp. BO4]|nr:hypothetical protein [Nitrospira sp. BO4]
MLDADAKEEYRNALIHYAQAKEILDLARCHRSRALCAILESDSTLTGAVEPAIEDDGFYEMLEARVLECLGGKVNVAALHRKTWA